MDRTRTEEEKQTRTFWLLRVLDAETKAPSEALYAIRQAKFTSESVRQSN